MIRLPLAALALALLGGCAYPYTPPALPPVTSAAPAAMTGSASVAPMQEERAPVTILVSIDGFRADYLQRGITPNLSRLAAGGVSAPMRPSFRPRPFQSLDAGDGAGSRSSRHRRQQLHRSDASGRALHHVVGAALLVERRRADLGTAEKAGIPTATMFWPGSTVAWGGVQQDDIITTVTNGIRPHDWQRTTRRVRPSAGRRAHRLAASPGRHAAPAS